MCFGVLRAGLDGLFIDSQGIVEPLLLGVKKRQLQVRAGVRRIGAKSVLITRLGFLPNPRGRERCLPVWLAPGRPYVAAQPPEWLPG